MSWLAKLFAIFRPPKVEQTKRRSDRVIADYKKADAVLRVERRAR